MGSPWAAVLQGEPSPLHGLQSFRENLLLSMGCSPSGRTCSTMVPTHGLQSFRGNLLPSMGCSPSEETCSSVDSPWAAVLQVQPPPLHGLQSFRRNLLQLGLSKGRRETSSLAPGVAPLPSSPTLVSTGFLSWFLTPLSDGCFSQTRYHRGTTSRHWWAQLWPTLGPF